MTTHQSDCSNEITGTATIRFAHEKFIATVLNHRIELRHIAGGATRSAPILINGRPKMGQSIITGVAVSQRFHDEYRAISATDKRWRMMPARKRKKLLNGEWA